MAACSAMPVAILRDGRPSGRSPQDEVDDFHSPANKQLKTQRNRAISSYCNGVLFLD
jgi:hypothetical protein